jgi:hypothetical protein
VSLKKRILGLVATATLVGTIGVVAAPAAHAVTIGSCSGISAIGKAKGVLDGLGLDNTQKQVKVSVKSTAGSGGTCSVGGPPLPIDAGGVKASLVGFASCDTSLTPPGMPLNGKIKVSAAGGAFAIQAYARFAGQPDEINSPDYVDLKGTVIKGPIAGADFDATIWYNPTAKDKTNLSGPFAGYNTDPVNSATLGAGCVAGANTLDLIAVGDGPSWLVGLVSTEFTPNGIFFGL